MDEQRTGPVILEWEPEVEDWYDVARAGGRGPLAALRRAAVRRFWTRATSLHRKQLATVSADGVTVETAFDTKRVPLEDVVTVDETERVWIVRTAGAGQGFPLAKRGAKSPQDAEAVTTLLGGRRYREG